MTHKRKRNPHRGVEQLVARRAHNPKVAGSSPVPATTSPVHPVHRAFLLRLCRAQSFGSKAHMKGPTCAACDGLGVKPSPLDSRHFRWRNTVPTSTNPVHRAFPWPMVGSFSCGHSRFVDGNEWLVEWLNKRETCYT